MYLILKSKYHREEKENPGRIGDALNKTALGINKEQFHHSEKELAEMITAINKDKIDYNLKDFSEDEEEEDGSAEKNIKNADSLGSSDSGEEGNKKIKKET